jgi:hypothetical protein
VKGFVDQKHKASRSYASYIFNENNKGDLRDYTIDLHYLDFEHSLIEVPSYLDSIKRKVVSGEIDGNVEPGVHIIKLLCGYGSGKKHKDAAGLKEKFRTFFKDNGLDFAYVSDNGVFLIKITQ